MSIAAKFLTVLAVATFVARFTSSAQAIPIPLAPGGTVVTSQTAGPPVGAVHVDGTVQNFASQDMPLNPNGTSFTGRLTSDVWTNYPGNLLGGLTFTYLLHNNGPDPLHRLVTTNFAGYQTSVEYDAVVVPGGLPSNTTDRDVTGKIIGWNYDLPPRLPAGTDTARLIIHTNAHQYVPSLASVINSATAGVLSFGPSPIPEPAALGALAGIAGLAIVRRRRGGGNRSAS